MKTLRENKHMKSFGQIAYEKAFDIGGGDPCRTWDTLSKPIQQGWDDLADAIAEEVEQRLSENYNS